MKNLMICAASALALVAGSALAQNRVDAKTTAAPSMEYAAATGPSQPYTPLVPATTVRSDASSMTPMTYSTTTTTQNNTGVAPHLAQRATGTQCSPGTPDCGATGT